MGDELFYLSSTVVLLFLVISNSLLSIATLTVAMECSDPTRDGDRREDIKTLQPGF